MDHGRASKKHSHSNNKASNNKRVAFKSSFVYPDQVSGIKAPSEPNVKGTVHGSAKTSDPSDSTYSFSSDSSSDEFVHINPKIVPKFKAPNIPKPYGPSKSTYKSEKLDVSSEALYRLKESINEPPQSTSQFSDITHESLFTHTSPILSPPVQVMERPAGPSVFDPDRIPSSIFGKPSNPTEWSVASNDSLFSIHIGNSSFSRDHTARVGYKSGELLKSGELCQSPETQFSSELDKSGELGMAADVATPGEEMGFGQTSTSAKVVKFDKNLDIERSFCEDMHPRKTGIVDERINDVPTNNRVDANVGESKDSYYDNRHSDKSERNIQSIVVTRKKKKKSSCHCCKSFFCCNWSIFSCNWTSCFFKWAFCSWPCCSTNCCNWPSCPSCKLPSCPSCKWPSCSSCCKWPSCSNCCKWPSCSNCCKWPSCSSCCKWPSCSSCSCKWPSCPSCCKWPSCSSCSCKWPSCCSCEWPTCLSCKCQCLSCSSSCCLCWKAEPQGSSYDYTSKNQGMTGSEKVCPEPQYATRSSPMKASSSSSSSKRCSCFSCTSSCSCCSC